MCHMSHEFNIFKIHVIHPRHLQVALKSSQVTRIMHVQRFNSKVFKTCVTSAVFQLIVESPTKVRLDGHGVNHNETNLVIQHCLLAFTSLLHHVGWHQIYICALHVDLYETSYTDGLRVTLRVSRKVLQKYTSQGQKITFIDYVISWLQAKYISSLLCSCVWRINSIGEPVQKSHQLEKNYVAL